MQSRRPSRGARCRTPVIGEALPIGQFCLRVRPEPGISVPVWEPKFLFCVVSSIEERMEANMGRGILLWLLGVPIPVIILLWLFFGH
jgi:hypothetical protein